MRFIKKHINKKGFALFGIFLMLGGSIAIAAVEDAQISREYYLKAAFLRYVVRYVEWPEEKLPELEYNLCVLGDIPSFKGINSINGKVVNDRTILVKPIQSVEQAKKHCQLVLVGSPERNSMNTIVEELKTDPVLAFGDFDEFAKNGGDMNFFIMNNRMAIMINPPAVYAKGLKISDKMLRLVSIVPEIDSEDFN